MSANLEYSKTLAGVGSILLLLSVVPNAGWVLGIVGVILLLRGMKEFANYYEDQTIYQSTWAGVKYYVVALIAGAVAVTAFVVGFGSATAFGFKNPFVLTAGFGVGLAAGIVGLIIAFIFYVLAASHLRHSFTTLAEKSGEASFRTAGEMLWLGAILTIVAVGLLLIFIAWIFAITGYFSIKPQQYHPYADHSESFNPSTTRPEQGKIIQSNSQTNGSQL